MIFAALDTVVALEIEPRFVQAGCAVISNSSAFRMDPRTPLVIPEVNPGHLDLIREQTGPGYLVTNPNCSAIGLVLALKPLHDAFGIESVLVTTMQAVSGAGYPGVPSLDILGNVVPFVRNEEEKMPAESAKLLGSLHEPLAMKFSAHCNRVPVEDGHTETVSVAFRTKPTREQILEAWRGFTPLEGLGLPTAPAQPVEYLDGEDRPQPRLDRMRGGGMASVCGRLRPCAVLDWKFTVLSHNTIRGAAGAALLNAELLHSQGRLLPQ